MHSRNGQGILALFRGAYHAVTPQHRLGYTSRMSTGVPRNLAHDTCASRSLYHGAGSSSPLPAIESRNVRQYRECKHIAIELKLPLSVGFLCHHFWTIRALCHSCLN